MRQRQSYSGHADAQTESYRDGVGRSAPRVQNESAWATESVDLRLSQRVLGRDSQWSSATARTEPDSFCPQTVAAEEGPGGMKPAFCQPGSMARVPLEQRAASSAGAGESQLSDTLNLGDMPNREGNGEPQQQPSTTQSGVSLTQLFHDMETESPARDVNHEAQQWSDAVESTAASDKKKSDQVFYEENVDELMRRERRQIAQRLRLIAARRQHVQMSPTLVGFDVATPLQPQRLGNMEAPQYSPTETRHSVHRHDADEALLTLSSPNVLQVPETVRKTRGHAVPVAGIESSPIELKPSNPIKTGEEVGSIENSTFCTNEMQSARIPPPSSAVTASATDDESTQQSSNPSFNSSQEPRVAKRRRIQLIQSEEEDSTQASKPEANHERLSVNMRPVSSTQPNRRSEPSFAALTPQLSQVPVNSPKISRVFALFKSTTPWYGPASLVRLKQNKNGYSVRFDNAGQQGDTKQIKHLELREGDIVSVALSNDDISASSPAYRVLSTVREDESSRQTDINGNDHVLVVKCQDKVSKRKRSRSVDDEAQSKSAKPVMVPISSVWLTTEQYNSLEGRAYEPSNGIHRAGLFAGMAFIVSRVMCNDDSDANRIEFEHTIEEYGGKVFSGRDYEEFFTADSRTGRASVWEALIPEEYLAHMTFACTIAFNFSRVPKYVQALALGFPCLHPEFVYDSIRKQELAHWPAYLLAAGECSALGGKKMPSIYKSMVVEPFDGRQSVIARLSARRAILHDKRALAYMPESRSTDRVSVKGAFLLAVLTTGHYFFASMHGMLLCQATSAKGHQENIPPRRARLRRDHCAYRH